MSEKIRVVLDASAILEFTKGNIGVGEIIAEVADEVGACVGLPMLCLTEAYRFAAESDRIDLLLSNPAVLVLAPDPDDWRALAITCDTVGRLDAASAVLAAIELGCDVVTNQPRLYAGLAGGGPVIPL